MQETSEDRHYLKMFKILLLSSGLTIRDYVEAVRASRPNVTTKNIYSLFLDYDSRCNIIDDTIWWEETKQGWEFWNKLNRTWYYCCNDFIKHYPNSTESMIVEKNLKKHFYENTKK